MKKVFIYIALIIILVSCTFFVTYSAVQKEDNVALVELLLKNFGWTPAEKIVFGDNSKYLRETFYDYLHNDIVPKSLPFGQELTTDDIDNMYIRSANFELKQSGLDEPLRCVVFLGNDKIIGIVIRNMDDEYFQYNNIYPISTSYQDLLRVY